MQTLRYAFEDLRRYLEDLVEKERDERGHAKREALYQGREVEGEKDKGRPMGGSAWKVEGLKALTVSPQGVLFAVGSDVVYRLESRGVIVRVASLGEFGAPGAIAADGLGRLWLLDRKGTRIGRVDPGTDQPVDAWQGREVRLTALVWDGRRLVGLDTRNQALVAIDPHGSRATLRDGFLKAEALAVDPAGRIAVLDQRSGAVLFYAADGSSLGAWSSQDAGVLRPTAIAFGWGGELHLFDESSASWVVLR